MWYMVLGVMCGVWYPCCVQWVVVYMCGVGGMCDVYVVCTCSGEYVVGFMCGACYMWCVCAMVLYVMWCVGHGICEVWGCVLWYVLYIYQPMAAGSRTDNGEPTSDVRIPEKQLQCKDGQCSGSSPPHTWLGMP